MEAAIILGLIVWFIASIPATTANARNDRLREEREEREYQQDRELIAHLKKNGDPLNLLPGLYERH